MQRLKDHKKSNNKVAFQLSKRLSHHVACLYQVIKTFTYMQSQSMLLCKCIFEFYLQLHCVYCFMLQNSMTEEFFLHMPTSVV